MAWTYKDPLTFPATFTSGFREAAASSTPFLLASSRNKKSLEVIANQFRHFRWCIRSKPEAHKALTSIELNHQIRTRQEQTEGVWFLYLVIGPTRLSEILRLNPNIEKILSEAVETY